MRQGSGLRGTLRAAAIDLGPLRDSADFRLLWSGQLVSMLGRQITVVALPLQVFRQTGSPLAVGALGLAQVVPLVCVSLFGGALADRTDRRRLLLATNTLLAGCSGLLAAGALLGTPPLAFLYTVAGVISALSAVDQPARSSTLPRLVAPGQISAAVALMFGLFQVSLIAGPAIGGVVIGSFGLGVAYLVDVATFAAAIAAVALLAPQPPLYQQHESPVAAVRTGLRHLREQRAILGGFAADLNAMVFGMPRALFPVLAATTFHTGPDGLGLLYAAPGAGAVIALLSAGWTGRVQRKGRVVLVAVAVWGIAIAAFGLTSTLWAALPLLAVAGAADSFSAICRNTMMQESTPDHLRGRTAAAYSMVVAGGPFAGDIEAGAVASTFTPRVSVVSGGVLCLLGLGAAAARFPELWRYRSPELPPAPAHHDAFDTAQA